MFLSSTDDDNVAVLFDIFYNTYKAFFKKHFFYVLGRLPLYLIKFVNTLPSCGKNINKS